jgi:hypothetical protein
MHISMAAEYIPPRATPSSYHGNMADYYQNPVSRNLIPPSECKSRSFAGLGVGCDPTHPASLALKGVFARYTQKGQTMFLLGTAHSFRSQGPAAASASPYALAIQPAPLPPTVDSLHSMVVCFPRFLWLPWPGRPGSGQSPRPTQIQYAPDSSCLIYPFIHLSA